MRLPDVKNAMLTAYLLGFESSQEGMNGEHGKRPASWYENRDQQIDEYIENHKHEEPAFPVPETVCDGRAFQPDHQGMTLRDYFAAKAIHGYLASFAGNESVPGPNQAAERAYQYADAMMRARGA
jgi:hypothetical protein